MNPNQIAFSIPSFDGDLIHLVAKHTPRGVRIHSAEHEHRYAVTIPESSLDHFIADLNGYMSPKVAAIGRSDHPAVDAVIRGKAERLGKGNDGVAYRVGDLVVKMSTTVPFQPFNSGHRTPAEAAKLLAATARMTQKLHDEGVPCVPWVDLAVVGDKAFEIKPMYRVGTKLNPDQVRRVCAGVAALHDRGLIMADSIQVGLDEHGNPWFYDLGSIRKGTKSKTAVYDDFEHEINEVRRFYKDNECPFIPTGSILRSYWGQLKRYDPKIYMPKNFIEIVERLAPYAHQEGIPNALEDAEKMISAARKTSKRFGNFEE